jgi:predicted nucleic acid-binding protein
MHGSVGRVRCRSVYPSRSVRCLDLLGDFSRVVIPDVVCREVTHHRPTALNQTTILLERLKPREEPSAELMATHRLLILHAGEAQALQLAEELDADLVLTDDTAARLAARTLQLSAHGTLGVMLRAIRRGQRTPAEILNVLYALPVRSTMHVKRELLDEIIRQVEQLT